MSQMSCEKKNFMEGPSMRKVCDRSCHQKESRVKGGRKLYPGSEKGLGKRKKANQRALSQGKMWREETFAGPPTKPALRDHPPFARGIG